DFLSPTVLKTFRIKKYWFVVLVLLAGASFFTARFIIARVERQPAENLSAAVAGKVIVVDPGHGGVDPGVTGKSGVLEKNINLAVAGKLASYLGQAGAMVLMTREADVDLSDPGTTGLLAQKRQDLERRVALANENRADLYLSIHVNSYPFPDRCGARTFVQSGAAGALEAARLIQAELARVVKNTDLVTGEVDYYITRSTLMPAVIVDIGFLSNEREEKLLQDPAYQSAVAWAVYAGTAGYFAGRAAEPGPAPDKEAVIKTFKEPVRLKTFQP
ncbi:MAG: N-acetylmuramoyl-L-alanine amidase, partial [Pelotomaculum thermopropionicum]